MSNHARLLCTCALAFACGDDSGRGTTGVVSASTTIDPTTSTTEALESSSTAPSAETSSTSPSADTSSSSASEPGSEASGSTASTSDDTGPADVCEGVDVTQLLPPTVCDGPNGNTTTEVPNNGVYATSWFGCYFEGDEIIQDPGDNCEFACGSQGLCPDGQDGPTCEAELQWFAADADRYGCGGRIRVTNCDNGNSVVLVTLDRGPNCASVEMDCDAPVLDMSHDAMVYLFDGGLFGGCEHETVVVEPVGDDTPLGPV